MILISDKDQEMRAVLQSLLQELGVCCVQAANAREIREQVSSGLIQVWVTDGILADANTEELLREVRAISQDLQILILTTAMDSESAQTELTRWVEAGATDFLVKPFDRSALVSKVQSLFRRRGLAHSGSDQTLSLGDLVLNSATSDVFCGTERAALTPSEFKLLRALLLRQGRVLSRDQLIELVQGAGIVVVDRAVDTHVASLRKKLGKCASVVETVRGVGYRVR